MTEDDLLWNLYLSEREFIRHHENQRTNASSILGAVAAGLVVAVGTQELSPPAQLVAAVVLTTIGVFGFMFCAKLYALIKLHAERSYRYLAVLDETVAHVSIADIKREADAVYKARFKRFSGIALNRIWAGFHLSIAAIGALLVCVSVTRLVMAG